MKGEVSARVSEAIKEANRGIIGIGPGPEFDIGGGYDSMIFTTSDPLDEPDWTIEERAQLAEVVISRWLAWVRAGSQ